MPHDILPFVGKPILLSALLFFATTIAADSVAPEILHLARIESQAKTGLLGVPAYTCSEVWDRSSRNNARTTLRKLDQLKFEVAEIGGKELYSRPGESNFNELAIKEFAAKGLVATGMFSHIAQTVFSSSAPRFSYVGVKKIKGKKALQYNLAVSPLFASYHLNFNLHEAQCGFQGSIWADETSFDLLRMHIEATDVPPELLLKSAITEIDYARTSLDGKFYLLPSSASITTLFLNGAESHNDIRFSNCHKYGVESTVTFQ